MHSVRIRNEDFDLAKAIKKVTRVPYVDIISQALEAMKENLPSDQKKRVDGELKRKEA